MSVLGKGRGASDAKQASSVAVLVDTATDWGRGVILGVTSYAQKHGPWFLQVEPRGRENKMQLPRDWSGDGIIARISNERIARDLQSRRVPVVNISGIELDGFHFPRVAIDYDAAAELAAEHFRSRGFRRFAYVGPLGLSYVAKQAEAFQNRIAKDGRKLNRFNYAYESMASDRWHKQSQRLGLWLAELRKPIAVFAWGTSASCQLLDVCRFRNIVVPDEVAVLAGTTDDVISQTTVPQMSGILNPSRQIGYRAAERLARMIYGQADDGHDENLAPIEVLTRGSTDVLAIEDPELFAAVRYIREHAFSELTVDAVASSVPMTRRSLERKFKATFDRTPLAEIHRLRIARVRELLATTDMPISQIAIATGFGTPEYMTTMFKRESGLTPLRYRSTTRAR